MLRLPPIWWPTCKERPQATQAANTIAIALNMNLFHFANLTNAEQKDVIQARMKLELH